MPFARARAAQTTRAARRAGKAACVGPGKALWHYVHVRDLALGYVTIMKAALAARGADREALEGFYFCESGGPFAWADLCKAIAEVLVEEGALKSADPMGVFSEKEHEELLVGDITWCVVLLWLNIALLCSGACVHLVRPAVDACSAACGSDLCTQLVPQGCDSQYRVRWGCVHASGWAGAYLWCSACAKGRCDAGACLAAMRAARRRGCVSSVGSRPSLTSSSACRTTRAGR